MLIKVLLFDLDNTLFDYDLAFEGFVTMLGLRYGVEVGDDMPLILKMNAKGYAKRVGFFEWFANRFGIEESPKKLWKTMQAEFPNYILVTDATKLLLTEYSKTYTVGILTNGSSTSQRNKLEGTGLDVLIPHIFISGELHCKKPNREIFDIVVDVLESEPEHILYVGDDWVNDIEGAKEAGWNTCWLSRGEPTPVNVKGEDSQLCDFKIDSLLELSSVLVLDD